MDDVRSRTDQLVESHSAATEREFLGAQFDAGLAWVQRPVGSGGLNLEASLQSVVDERLRQAGRLYSWLRNPMGIGMVSPALLAHGTSKQRERHLRPIFTTEEIWCQLFSEPSAGSDVSTLGTRASHDGDAWTINGQKVWTTSASESSFGLLLARTDPDLPKHLGLTTFILDMSLPGVTIRPLRQMTGHADEFCEVFFDDVQIGDEARVGEPGEGWQVAITMLMNERVSIGGGIEPRGAGPIAAVTNAYRNSTTASPSQRDRLMRVWIEAEVYRLGNVRAQQMRMEGTPGPEGSVLKLGNALVQQTIAELALELIGPAGMLYDYANTDSNNLGYLLMDSRSTTIAGGTSEIMRNIISERILGLPRDIIADRDIPWSQIPRGV